MQKIYAQIDDNGKVYAISQLASEIVELPAYDERYMGTTYDRATGTFIGYIIQLSADKTQIAADGVDTASITATVTDYLGNPAPQFGDDIVFEVNGQLQAVTPEGGEAKLTLTSTQSGTLNVKTVNGGYVKQNDNVTISVV